MKTILLVDDSTSIRNILKTTLTKEFQVLEAEDGQAALRLLETRPGVDLFLLDVNMPHMDGLSLLKILKDRPEFRGTPALMLTTETKAERRQEAKALGAAGWVLKPCDPEKLLGAIHLILG